MSPTNICDNFCAKWRLLFIYTTREHCLTILYHVIENTVANTINVTINTHGWSIGRLDIQCIPIVRIFYGMV